MRLKRVDGSVADFHARPIPADLDEPEVWLFVPERPTLVLGSAQDESVTDPAAVAAASVDVVRRRSGGGAVFVDPERCLWLDVVLPRHDRLWTDDVRKSPLWLGAAWSRALAAVGIEAELYDDGLEKTPWGRLVCFAAMGPGELLVGGRKAVGISQRRTREGARFQCIVYDRWDPRDVLDLLTLSADDRARASADLAGVAVGVGDLLLDLEDAILAELLG